MIRFTKYIKQNVKLTLTKPGLAINTHFTTVNNKDIIIKIM